MANRLASESSPYLLQHAHNPVDWHPWGEEALSKARQQDKPILVSIGYAACHWCHVMEKESFEDVETARLMNDHFVNIKIDREERPDLDHIYMDAVQAMTGSGGWPLNVFLTPDKKPFYGGTYFPPQRAFNRASWKEVLSAVAEAYQSKREEIEQQADNLTDHLTKSNDFGLREGKENAFTKEFVESTTANLLKSADTKDGGFGKAPKFPQTFSIQFLLHHFYHTQNQDAFDQANLSLEKMIRGGLYDQIGGGFARYSTDPVWLVPHFEKMLYDNALLLIVLAEAYQVTNKPLYINTIKETIAFVERELMSPDYGFYSALDADSEGVEGKYYVWEKKEIEDILGEDARIFCEYYGVSDKGNWEHTNILHRKAPDEEFAASKNLSLEDLLEKLEPSKSKLLDKRQGRVRPLLDDKILLGWNALMNLALTKVSAALAEEEYKMVAVRNMEFLFKALKRNDSSHFNHTFKNGESKYPAFLDDYAYLIQALVGLQELTADVDYLKKAEEITQLVIDQFSDDDNLFFFYTGINQQDVLVRKKELYDGAVPSGNSIMAMNLYSLGVLFDKPSWKSRAEKMVAMMAPIAAKYPTSFGVWATLMQAFTYGVPEIALLGKDIREAHREFLRAFVPVKIFQPATHENENFPLLAGKMAGSTPQFFLCKNYACQLPVAEVYELKNQIKKSMAF